MQNSYLRRNRYDSSTEYLLCFINICFLVFREISNRFSQCRPCITAYLIESFICWIMLNVILNTLRLRNNLEIKISDWHSCWTITVSKRSCHCSQELTRRREDHCWLHSMTTTLLLIIAFLVQRMKIATWPSTTTFTRVTVARSTTNAAYSPSRSSQRFFFLFLNHVQES